MLRFVLYFVFFFVVFRILSSVLKLLFRKDDNNQIKNNTGVKKSRYQNIEEAKYTEIEVDDEKKS